MNALELIRGRDFHCVGDTIKCHADREGADLWMVSIGCRNVAVLAHDEKGAIRGAQDHTEDFRSKAVAFRQ